MLAARSRLVSIVGPGGCGKTRLAFELFGASARQSERAQPTHPPPTTDGVWWVELAAVAGADELALAVLDDLGGRDDPLRDPFDQMVDALISSTLPADGDGGVRPVTLLLDNGEHLTEPLSVLVDALLGAVAGLSIVVTSREALGVSGEAVYRVPPLALAHADSTAHEMRASDSVALFLDRACLVRPETAILDDELLHVAEICRRVDGLPLAVELAAARLNLLSPARIADGLRDRFRLLVTGNRAAQPRHRTLEACVEWSYALLAVDEKLVLERLAVFRGSFTLDAVVAVTRGSVASDVVFEVMDRLAEKSLVVADPRPAGTRFHLLETMAAFAGQRLAENGNVGHAQARLLDYVDQLTARGDRRLSGADQDRLLHDLRDDEGNIRAALAYAAGRASDDPEAASTLWAIIGRLTFFWSNAGRFREARTWFDAACSCSPMDVADALPARWGASHLALYAGDLAFAAATAAAVLEQATDSGDDQYAARALNTIGSIELFDDPRRSMITLGRAIDAADTAGDLWCITDARQVLAYTHLVRYEFTQAERLFDEARPVAEELDHPLLRAWDAIGRATIAIGTGQLRDVDSLLDDALEQISRTDDPNLTALLVVAQASAAQLRGHGANWIQALEEALEVCQRTEAGASLPTVARTLAMLLIDEGEATRASTVLDTYLDSIVAFAPAMATRALITAAVHSLSIGDRSAADDHIRAAGDAANTSQSRAEQALVETMAGLAAHQRGDYGTAEATTIGALSTLADLGLLPTLIDALETLALIHGSTGNRVAAHRLAGTARAQRRTHAIRRTELQPVTAAALEAALEGPTTEDELVAEKAGAGAAIEDVVAFVKRSRGERRRPSIGWNSLTPTEFQVVELITRGSTNAETAEQLFISPATVKTHVAHIYRKLDIANRSALTAAYLTHLS